MGWVGHAGADAVAAFVGAESGVAGQTIAAALAGYRRFDGHQIALLEFPVSAGVTADSCDAADDFVPHDVRRVEIGPVVQFFVVVIIAAADTAGLHFEHRIVGAGDRHGELPHLQAALVDDDGGE